MELFTLYGFIAIFGNPLYATYYGFNMADGWLLWTIAAAVYVVICAFKGIGLYAMAKKQGKNKLLCLLGFVPFASTYAMGELAAGFRLGNAKIKHIGLYAMLAEFVLCVAYGMYDISQSVIFANGWYNIQTIEQGGSPVLSMEYTTAVPQALVNVMNVCNIFGNIFYFVWLVLFIFLCMAFFRTYAPASYIWMVVLCALFPVVTAFLIFAFRNRAPIDYDKYMQERMERIRRAQQAQYGPYGQNPYGGNPYGGNPYGQNPYGQNPYGQNPYGQNPYGQNGYGGQGAPKEPDDPFGEYSSSPSSNNNGGNGPQADDPFGEYSGGQGNSGENKNS